MRNKSKKNNGRNYKKIIAIALCIGIITPSFSSIIISYAKNKPTENSELEYQTVKAPNQDIIELTPEIDINGNVVTGQNVSAYSTDISGIPYENTGDAVPLIGLYNIGNEELQKLLQEGFSIQEIVEADQIGNEMGEDPVILLKDAKSSGVDLKDIKEEKLQELKKECLSNIKSKNPNEYKKLKNENFSDDDIICFMGYIEENNLLVTDELIKEFKSNGNTLLTEKNDKDLSNETKKKYKITEMEATYLTENMLNQLEDLSQKSGKPVKELIKLYLKNIEN